VKIIDLTQVDASTPTGDDAAYPPPSEAGSDVTTPTPSPDGAVDSGPVCPRSRALELDTMDATLAVSMSRTELYSFTLAQPQNVLVRVRTAAASPKMVVSTACDGTGASALPTSIDANGGAYVRGALPAGSYVLRIDWDSTVATGGAYAMDVLRYAVASNAVCASPAPLTTSAVVIGNTFQANDATSGGCGVTTSGLGQLFYSVSVPAYQQYSVTALPGGPWHVVVAAIGGCNGQQADAGDSGAAACPNTASGAPATITLTNPTAAALAMAVSVTTDQATSGGGDFALEAAPVPACTAGQQGNACNANGQPGLCCSGSCGVASTSNSCLASCNACPTDPSGHGTALCNGSGKCDIQCVGSYAKCGTSSCQYDTSSDSNHCGSGCTSCGTAPQHMVGWGCSNGTCGGSCASGYGDCNNNLSDGCETPLNTSANCGACGNNCAMGAPTGATVSCSAQGMCSSTCPLGTCLDYTTTPASCAGWNLQHCGTYCFPCQGWQSSCTPQGICQ
jgi:hypothetical protein